MGNCVRKQPSIERGPLKRNLHDERKCGVSFTKSQQKMGVETSCTGTMTHDLEEEILKPTLEEKPILEEKPLKKKPVEEKEEI